MLHARSSKIIGQKWFNQGSVYDFRTRERLLPSESRGEKNFFDGLSLDFF
jgi:hypothetical protein